MKKKNVAEEDEDLDVVVSKGVKEKENKTFLWVLIIIGIVFGSILIPYFWIESTKSFEFAGISWMIEDYEGLRIFHGRFLSLTNPNLHYNIFLRNDPRENDVEILGNFDSFKYGGIISLSPEVDACRGDLSRVMLDLGAFLKQGIGVGVVESASNDQEVANETGRAFVNCNNTLDRTVVVVEIGEDVGIAQDEDNPYCYTITAEDCEDSRTVEKFMIDSVQDARNAMG